MTIQEYLAESEPVVSAGASGAATESDWLDVSDLRLDSGKLAVIDPTLFTGPVFDLSPGRYRVCVRVWTQWGDRRISRLRVVTGADGLLGLEIGAVGVDFAQVAVGDWEACRRAISLLDDATADTVCAALDAPTLTGVLTWSEKPAGRMPWVRSGFGDGRYPVYEVVTGGRRTGIEVVFIPHEAAAAPDG